MTTANKNTTRNRKPRKTTKKETQVTGKDLHTTNKNLANDDFRYNTYDIGAYDSYIHNLNSAELQEECLRVGVEVGDDLHMLNGLQSAFQESLSRLTPRSKAKVLSASQEDEIRELTKDLYS